MLLLQALRLKLAYGSNNGSGLLAFLPCCQEVLTAIPKVHKNQSAEAALPKASLITSDITRQH
jgi:hypothetical protein